MSNPKSNPKSKPNPDIQTRKVLFEKTYSDQRLIENMLKALTGYNKIKVIIEKTPNEQ
jgi:hypothetical protein